MLEHVKLSVDAALKEALCDIVCQNNTYSREANMFLLKEGFSNVPFVDKSLDRLQVISDFLSATSIINYHTIRKDADGPLLSELRAFPGFYGLLNNVIEKRALPSLQRTESDAGIIIKEYLEETSGDIGRYLLKKNILPKRKFQAAQYVLSVIEDGLGNFYADEVPNSIRMIREHLRSLKKNYQTK